MELTLDGNALRVQPVLPPDLTLEDLLAGVTEKNLHESIDTADDVGAEAS